MVSLRPDDIGPLFLFTLLEQKRTGIGAISNPDGNNPGRKRSFRIKKKDVFQLILTLNGWFRERISESITSQRKGSSRIGNGCQKGLGRATLGLVYDDGAEPFPWRKHKGRQTASHCPEVQTRILEKTMKPFLPRMGPPWVGRTRLKQLKTNGLGHFALRTRPE